MTTFARWQRLPHRIWYWRANGGRNASASWSARSTSHGRWAKPSAAAGSRMPFFSPGFAASAKPPPRGFLRAALIAIRGRPPSRAANVPPVSKYAAGAALDVVEIDGATYRKIDDARAIIENLSYRPARDRFKIYIIDEAHQLTDQAFNALLKTLEEPPPTSSSSWRRPSRRRCPRRSSRGCSATIFGGFRSHDLCRLKELASFERAQADDAALRLIAREAGGSMRDAERMLETAIASLDGKVAEGEVAGILGVASRSRVIALAEAILNKDAASALRTFANYMIAAPISKHWGATSRNPAESDARRSCREQWRAKSAGRSARSGSAGIDAVSRPHPAAAI